jgi:SnoaL-like domain
LTDGESIVQLMNLYALAIDAKQLQIWDRVFTPDVRADYPWGHWEGLDSWREAFEESIVGPFDVTQHLMLNVTWNLSGPTGRVLTQGLFHMVRRGFPGGDMMSGGAWFDAGLQMTSAGWRISEQTCRVTWMSGNAAVMSRRPPAPPTSMSEGMSDGTLKFFDTLRLA